MKKVSDKRKWMYAAASILLLLISVAALAQDGNAGIN